MAQSKLKIGIIGAGPGGMTAAMLLAAKGHQVCVFERQRQVGGRNGSIEKNGYRFDMGPTFLIYKDILEECFAEARENVHDYLDLIKLSPMYSLHFVDQKVSFFSERQQMEHELENHFPDAVSQYRRFLREEAKRFKLMKPCLQKHYSSIRLLADLDLLRAFPALGVGQTVFSRMHKYFKDERLALGFSFQTKYLGMSAWKCPAMFSIIPYLEHHFGIYHVCGGLSNISQAMAKVVRKHNGKIVLGSEVEKIIVEKGRAKGIRLKNGEERYFDKLVVNADFAYAMTELFEQESLYAYKRENVEKMKFSCSTYMLYLGLDKQYPIDHHNVVIAEDYKRNVNEIFQRKILSRDPSFYVRNASLIDPSLAPKDHSALYVLIPVPNLDADIDWKETDLDLREKVLSLLERRLGMLAIRDHIREEIRITPKDWENMNIYKGATFSLAHSWDQIAMFRPSNAFCDVKDVFLVGGGTHPGSGLPTIYESGRIAANLINQNYR